MTAAKQDRAKALSLLRTVPGIGNILRVVRLDESHAMQRFPRGQAFVSYGRLVTCAKASAGKRYGVSGTKRGNASLTWAFAAAAALCLRNHPAGQKVRARLAKKHGQGKAFTGLAHKRARAVHYMLKRGMAFDLDKCLHQ